MYGRYGQDDLSRFLLIVALVLLIANLLFRLPGSAVAVLLILGYNYFRMFSRNVPARYAENQKFLELKERFLGLFRRNGSHARQQQDHMIFRCPKCSQKIRIPCGKGMVEITCPKCRTKFRKRT
jgi:hypothetical protein